MKTPAKSPLFIALAALLALLLAGCGSAAAPNPEPMAAGVPPPAAAATPGPAEAASPAGPDSWAAWLPAPVSGYAPGTAGNRQERLITTARLTLEVRSVTQASNLARAMAVNQQGYVARLTSPGGAEPARTDLTLRVPQLTLARTLAQLEGLGRALSRSLVSETAPNRGPDLAARLRSRQQEEQRLASLLERSSAVDEILNVERELARVRAEIEQAQAGLAFLEDQVALATLHVTLLAAEQPEVVSRANYRLDVSNVDRQVASLEDFVANREGQLERVHRTTTDAAARATVFFRVPAGEFEQTIEFIEGQGGLRYREVQQELDPAGAAGPLAGGVAHLQVTYVDGFVTFPVWWLLAALLALAALAGGGAYLLRLAYRRGRMRGRFI